jgi:hypothetical protein
MRSSGRRRARHLRSPTAPFATTLKHAPCRRTATRISDRIKYSSTPLSGSAVPKILSCTPRMASPSVMSTSCIFACHWTDSPGDSRSESGLRTTCRGVGSCDEPAPWTSPLQASRWQRSQSDRSDRALRNPPRSTASQIGRLPLFTSRAVKAGCRRHHTRSGSIDRVRQEEGGAAQGEAVKARSATAVSRGSATTPYRHLRRHKVPPPTFPRNPRKRASPVKEGLARTPEIWRSTAEDSTGGSSTLPRT